MFHRLFTQLLSNWVCMTLGAGRCPRGMFLNLGTEVWETSQAVGKCRVTPDSYTGLRGEVLWSMQLMKQFLVQAPRSDFQSGIKTSNPLNENIHSASVSSGCSTEQKGLASQKKDSSRPNESLMLGSDSVGGSREMQREAPVRPPPHGLGHILWNDWVKPGSVALISPRERSQYDFCLSVLCTHRF